MKWLLILFLIPFSALAQTVHMEDEEIVYKGAEDVNAISFHQLTQAVQQAVDKTKNKNADIAVDSAKNEIVVNGEMKMKSDQTTTNSIRYRLKVKMKEDGYKYEIDSVAIAHKERGYNTTTVSSKDLIKLLDYTGPVATTAEGQLDEVDMRFRKLLDLIKNNVQK